MTILSPDVRGLHCAACLLCLCQIVTNMANRVFIYGQIDLCTWATANALTVNLEPSLKPPTIWHSIHTLALARIDAHAASMSATLLYTRHYRLRRETPAESCTDSTAVKLLCAARSPAQRKNKRVYIYTYGNFVGIAQ